MPGEQAQFGRETRYAEDLDGLIREKRRKRDRRDARFRESERGHSHDLSVAVAQRTVRADEFSHAVCPRPDVTGTDVVNMRVSFQCRAGLRGPGD